MANIKSTTIQKQESRGFENPTEPTDIRGRVRHAYAYLNTTSQPVNNGDTIELFRLPKGARILGLSVDFGAMGTSATVIIGDAADNDRYLESTSVASAGRTDTLAATGFGYLLTEDTTIVATAGGANYAAARDFKVALFYVTD